MMSRVFIFLLSALLSGVCLAQDYSPFSLLGSNGPLNGTEFANDNFSPSDKIVVCEGSMVFVDLDAQISFFEEGPQLTLERCANAFAPASKLVQVWNYQASTTYPGLGYIVLSNPPNYYWNNTCLNIPVDSAMQANATVNTFECLPGKEQLWNFNPNGNIVMMGNGSAIDNGGNMCLTVGYPGDLSRGLAGSALTTALCDPSLPFTQVFAWTSPGNIVLASTQGNTNPVCVDAGHLGQVISYNPTSSSWSISPTHSEVCRDPQGEEISNPPFLPRTSLRDYTVGVKRMSSDILGFDRLIILDGDNADNNVWYSDDCGVNWNCFPGTNPWSTSGLALATVMQVPSTSWDYIGINDGVLNFGGVNYDPNDVYVKSSMYYSGNGFQYATLPTTLPNSPSSNNNESVVWPGMVATDGKDMYFFGDDTFDSWPEAVYKLDAYSFSSGGSWAQLQQGEMSLSAVPKGRYFYMAGTSANGCWFSSDYHAGATWGNPDGETWSTNLWFTSWDLKSWRMGPVNAPWAPRAASGWTQTADLSKAYMVGGMEFTAGVPNGNTFSDAWSMDASVCLYGDNGKVCSGNGNPDLAVMVCNCFDFPAGSPYLGQYCDQCPTSTAGPFCEPCATCVNGFCNGNGTITGDASCICNAGWSGPACDQNNATLSSSSTPSVSSTPSNSPVGPGQSPSRTPSRTRSPARTPSRTPIITATITATPGSGGGGGGGGGGASSASSSSGVSPGAAAGISITVILLALGGGGYVFVTYFGGAAYFSGYTSVVKGSGGGGGGGGIFAASSGAASETKSLFKVGSKIGTTVSSSQAASRFSASGGSAVPASTSFQGGTQLKGSYTSF